METLTTIQANIVLLKKLYLDRSIVGELVVFVLFSSVFLLSGWH